MSDYVNIPIALLKDKRLSLSDVQVYAALIQLSGENRRCNSTRDEIQHTSGVQRVSRHTQNLFRCGHIHIDKARDGHRNIYAIITGDKMNKSTQSDFRRVQE